MGADIPLNILKTPLFVTLLTHLDLHNIGKVRDTFELPDHPDKLLVVASDRVSIFDFTLNAIIHNKGYVLTAMTVFWLQGLLKSAANHLVAYGRNIDDFLPPALRDNTDLRRRALVVRKLDMYPIECIARGFLTGTGWKDYSQTGQVCGHKLLPGLRDGSKLPMPIFTPSTKAETGHDENIDAGMVNEKYGADLGQNCVNFYLEAQEFAEKRGIIIADTKFEFGQGEGWDCVLGDEVLTPDSSRFWDIDHWRKAGEIGKSPSGYDKQPLRETGKKAIIEGVRVDINAELDPKCQKDRAKVWNWHIPEPILTDTYRRYATIFYRLTGHELDDFQSLVMKT